jgi:NhaA family Na+:H+ antiporter
MIARKWLVSPFEAFTRTEASGGILLLLAAVVAMVWANSPLAESYFSLWSTTLTVGVGDAALSKPLQLWINDGLMALFFLLVGLEIKREVLVGELSSPRQAALPLAGAVGGMVVPAAFYVAFNLGTPTLDGWAVPMATDIAFALGIMALLGSRVPTALKVFLTALAIADDLAAVLVIALFYTADLALLPLAATGLILLLLVGLNRAGVRHPGIYLAVGAALWLAVLKSGVHATVAGVLLAMTVPARRKMDLPTFARRAGEVLDLLEAEEGKRPSPEAMDAVHGLEVACSDLDTPLARLEHGLHPWSAYLIMPVFALANAGVAIGSESLGGLTSSAGMGVVAGLFLGKQIGVTGFAWLAERMGWASRSEGVSWRQVHGVACLCGIGFTMSLFIAGLAFPAGSPVLDGTKLAIVVGSLLSGLLGWTLLSGASGAGPDR